MTDSSTSSKCVLEEKKPLELRLFFYLHVIFILISYLSICRRLLNVYVAHFAKLASCELASCVLVRSLYNSLYESLYDPLRQANTTAVLVALIH